MNEFVAEMIRDASRFLRPSMARYDEDGRIILGGQERVQLPPVKYRRAPWIKASS
jgi:hypothetical protein